MKHPHPYRTVLVALAGMACLVGGLCVAAHWPAAASVYPAFVGGIVACVGAQAAKASIEKRAAVPA